MPTSSGAIRRRPPRSFNEAAGADPADALAADHFARIQPCFNEAAGADPADAFDSWWCARIRFRFNEAAGADPADAPKRMRQRLEPGCFNEAAGADPADAGRLAVIQRHGPFASMRPRGQTPRMLSDRGSAHRAFIAASMRPRGQTPRMLGIGSWDTMTDCLLQ